MIIGDSTGIPTEDDVVKDAMFIFEYVKNKAKTAHVYIWGHSLGTGVTTKAARLLNEKSKAFDC